MKFTPMIAGLVLMAAQTTIAFAQAEKPDCQVETTDETQTETLAETDESGSDQLQRCGGVLEPPQTGDTGLVEQPDESGRTPVIPPAAVPEPDSEDEQETDQ